jgi:hypothetical protein
MKQTKLNFNGVAIKCDTWQQMLHLAELAEMQGYGNHYGLFSKEDFEKGDKYFSTFGNDIYGCQGFVAPSETETTYTTFINPPVDDSVYGC